MEERAALAACRGLSAAGYRVVGAAAVRPAAGHWSRACAGRIYLPDARTDPAGFATELDQALAAVQPAALLPGIEASLLIASEQRTQLETLTRIGLPPPAAVERSVDKVFQLEQAAALGVAAPLTLVVGDPAEVGDAATELGFPLILKPARSVRHLSGELREGTSTLVTDASTLASAVGDLGTPLLLQRFEVGRPLISCSGVFAGGRLLALSAARVLRTFPPDAGAFSFAETIEPPPRAVEAVEGLLGATGWQGIFQVDFLDGEGSLALIDLNARLFGAMALDIAAGANLPAVWCDWLLGRDPAPVRARTGVRFRWEEGDARHALRQLRRGRLRAAFGALRPRRRTNHAFFRLMDPAPILARPIALAVDRLRRSRS